MCKDELATIRGNHMAKKEMQTQFCAWEHAHNVGERVFLEYQRWVRLDR